MTGAWKDERGKDSMGRRLLVATMIYTGALIVLDATKWDVPGPAYVLLGTAFTGLLAWVAGPRIGQAIAGQMGAVASGIAAAAGRRAGTDDHKTDDERG